MGKQYSTSQSVLSPGRRSSENHVRNKSGHRKSEESLSETIRKFLKKPEDLDFRGLGSRLCEILGVQSGDRIEFHVLADGSVRVINCGDN
ncbi:MAG TPA: hypothetical protein VLV18_08410 [Terriglobales bacterium]|nr:hypothetical protein [Terriglobales bacterium]